MVSLASPQSLTDTWSIDVQAGDRLTLGAATGGFTLDGQILATDSQLVYEPALSVTTEEFTVSSGGSVEIQLVAPAALAGEP